MALNESEIATFAQSQVVHDAKSAAGSDRQKAELDRLFIQLREHNRLSFSYQAERAFKKYADGILNGIKIFVSYKIGFGEAASAIIEPFKIYGNGRICVEEPFPYICERAAGVGKDYSMEIAEALDQAHWFFLLLPDQSLDRSWTLFEAGYFKRAMGIEDRLIGIHHSNVEMAGPLKNLQAVQAESENICSFLKDLLQKPNPIPGMSPINPEVSLERFNLHSESISKAIQPSKQVWRQYRIDYMDIKLKGGQAPKDIKELLESVVVEGRGFEKIFGYCGLSDNIRLREIILPGEYAQGAAAPDESKMALLERSGYFYWLEAIVEAIQAAVDNRACEPSDVILIGRDKRYYRPTLLSVRRYTDTNAPESVHIAFHESVTGPIQNCPTDLSALGTVLRMGFRFKWEVLEQFKFGISESDVDSVRRIIERMERESHQRGYHEPDRTVDEFQESSPVFAAFAPETQPEIKEIAEQWYALRNPERTGRLDQALNQKNTKETKECLRLLKQINRKFMTLGAKRYGELVEQYWE